MKGWSEQPGQFFLDSLEVRAESNRKNLVERPVLAKQKASAILIISYNGAGYHLPRRQGTALGHGLRLLGKLWEGLQAIRLDGYCRFFYRICELSTGFTLQTLRVQKSSQCLLSTRDQPHTNVLPPSVKNSSGHSQTLLLREARWVFKESPAYERKNGDFKFIQYCRNPAFSSPGRFSTLEKANHLCHVINGKTLDMKSMQPVGDILF